MSTTLSNCEIELSKQLSDYWSGTFTSGTKNTGVDVALKNKSEDWIGEDTWIQMLTLNVAADTSERLISALNNTTGTLTFINVASNVANADTYRVHRIVNASDKKEALIHAARTAFPWIHEEIRDECKTSGDWLKDGALQSWSAANALTYWTTNAVTLTRTNTVTYVRRGQYSAKLDSAMGDISQGITNVSDLLELAGKQVTFKGRLHCDVPGAAFLQIYDGVSPTSSGKHPGNTKWCNENGDDDFIEVTATIADAVNQLKFSVVVTHPQATVYVSDLRLIGPRRDKIFIGDLDLSQETPYRVSASTDGNIFKEPWIPIRGADIDTTNGWMYLPSIPSDLRLRLEGCGYLSFKESGSVSTNWAAAVNVNSPQLDILVAQAGKYLMENMLMPNKGGSDDWEKSLMLFNDRLREAKKFSMDTPTILTEFGI